MDLTAATHATFIRADLARTINTFVSSPDAFQSTLATAEASPQLAGLTGDGAGSVRLATQRQIVEEVAIIERARVLSTRVYPAPSAAEVRAAVAATEAELGGADGTSARLSEQQRAALAARIRSSRPENGSDNAGSPKPCGFPCSKGSGQCNICAHVMRRNDSCRGGTNPLLMAHVHRHRAEPALAAGHSAARKLPRGQTRREAHGRQSFGLSIEQAEAMRHVRAGRRLAPIEEAFEVTRS